MKYFTIKSNCCQQFDVLLLEEVLDLLDHIHLQEASVVVVLDVHAEE